MKKILLFLIVFIMLCTFTVRADEYTLYEGVAKIYNDFKEDFDSTHFKIKYDDVRETYYLYTYRDYSYDAWIYLSESDLQIIRNALIKFKDWEKIAKENNVKLNKEIPDSRIKTKVDCKKYYITEKFRGVNLELSFSFFSQSAYLHQFVISADTIISENNSTPSLDIKELYIYGWDIDEFLSGIDVNTISEKKKEHSKQKDLFQ